MSNFTLKFRKWYTVFHEKFGAVNLESQKNELIEPPQFREKFPVCFFEKFRKGSQFCLGNSLSAEVSYIDVKSIH